jgi:hypothetical protein
MANLWSYHGDAIDCDYRLLYSTNFNLFTKCECNKYSESLSMYGGNTILPVRIFLRNMVYNKICLLHTNFNLFTMAHIQVT